jgi:CHAT domain-containing protein
LKKNNSIQFSESLRQAKLEMIRGEKFSSPYYWAPFVLIGQ